MSYKYKFNPFTGKLDRVNNTAPTYYKGYGSTIIDFPDRWYMQDNDGEFILDSNGNKIFTGFPGNPVLDSDGNEILDSNGDVVIDSNVLPHGLGGYKSPYILDSDGEIILDDNDDPIVDPNWRLLVVDGIATQLDTLETNVQYVSIQAKWTNLGKIWLAQDRTPAIYLRAGGTFTRLVSDLRDIYIIGNAGEGVNYEYGTIEDAFLTSPDGSFITSPDGSQINV